MPSAQIDIKGKIKVYPYVRPEVNSVEQQSIEEAADIDKFISELESGVAQIPGITQLFNIETVVGAGIAGKDQWSSANFEPDAGHVGDIIKGLDKAIGKIDKLMTVLYKVLKIIELFISGFSSFSKLISSAITLAQKKLNEYVDSGLTAGIYANILAPPALLKKSVGDIDAMNQLRGGFDGFTARLENSLNNTKDINRPPFTIEDYVGGLIILLDTESLDVLWMGLKQLASMFDFIKLFGLDLAPPPPTNLRGFCGSFTDENHETPSYGVQIEWDQSYTTSGFMLYRSRVPGGTTTLVEYVPSAMFPNKETGEPGFLNVVRDRIRKIFKKEPLTELPEKIEMVYEDPDFTPVYIPAGFNPSLKYVDYLTTKKITVDGNDIEVPYYIDDYKNEILVTNYYYIIRSCDTEKKYPGPYSKELCIAIKVCNDSYKLADLIAHPNGRYEFFSMGYGKINSWSTIQVSLMIPWIKDVVGYMNKFLESLGGMVTGVSESFSHFLDEIKAKIQMYVDLLKLISWFISGLENFLLGSSIAFLDLDIKKGGMPVFMERVKKAQPPEGHTFSGPYGITVGVVLVIGGSNLPVLKATVKTLKFIKDFFTD